MESQKLIELEQAVVRCTRMLDALVTLHCGWNDESKAIYTEAQKLVWTTARKLRLERQLRDLNESASNDPSSATASAAVVERKGDS